MAQPCFRCHGLRQIRITSGSGKNRKNRKYPCPVCVPRPKRKAYNGETTGERTVRVSAAYL